MNFKEILKVAANLVVIYAIGGMLLAGLYAWAAPIIYKNNVEDKNNALKAMMPEATKPPQKMGDWEPWHKHAAYYSVEKDGAPLGYIIETYGKGYSSYISVLVAVDANFVVKKINVLKHGETPGLGDEIEAKWFKDQYVGKDYEHLVVIKGETQDKIQAITGATISTRAVTNGVKEAVALIKDKASAPAAAPAAEHHHGGHGNVK